MLGHNGAGKSTLIKSIMLGGHNYQGVRLKQMATTPIQLQHAELIKVLIIHFQMERIALWTQ
ncbi:hypothetical protein O9929_11695 [Vibrio lentus]|nr:hypothetical protein [Vibrio lentus]